VAKPIEISTALGALAAGTGAIASQLPGLSFFTSNAPPSFGLLGLMTSGLTLAIFVRVLATTPEALDRSRAGLLAVAGAVVLGLSYVSLLNWVTVPAPVETGVDRRYQIGFGLSDFSLTDRAKAALKTGADGVTSEDLMLMNGAFRPGGPQLLWKPWTITLARALLSAVFLLAYFLWSFGLACVATRMVKRSSQ
jgi:hypothetical protein